MPTSSTSDAITRAYCTTADVKPYLAPNVLGEGAANPITIERLVEETVANSRILDGLLGARCFTPFTTPAPALVKKWVIYATAAEVWLMHPQGNRKSGLPARYLGLRDSILREENGVLMGSLLSDLLLNFVAAETLGGDTLDGASTEFGWLGATPMLRLRNRGLIVDGAHPLKFLDAAGYEVRDTAGLPYGPRRGWSVSDPSQSTISVTDYSRVQAEAASVSYWFSYWDASYFNTEPASLSGVAAYGG